MNIAFLFLIPERGITYTANYSEGIATMSSVLKKHNNNIRVLTLHKLHQEKVDNLIEEFKPKIVGISFTYDQVKLVKIIGSYVKRKFPTIFLIAGGPHTIVCPEDVISISGLDAICIGEGEIPIVELIDKMQKKEDISNIKGLWIKKRGKFIKNEICPTIKDLNSLPFPDRTIFNYQYSINTFKHAEFFAGRGCPYKCTYCINHKIYKLYKKYGYKVRLKSVDYLISEILDAIKKYQNIKCITFHDDVFILNKKWLREFSYKYKKKINLPFACNVRAKLIDEEIIMYLKNANCFEVRMGVESGNDFIRNRIMKRDESKKQIKKASRIIKEAGMHLWVFNLLGVPYETEETIKETISLNKEIKPDRIAVSLFKPYPETDLYNFCLENNLISERNTDSYYRPISILNLPTISRRKLELYFRIFELKILHPNLCLLAQILTSIYICKDKTLYDFIRKTIFRNIQRVSNIIPYKIQERIRGKLKI
ncbi:radical SAM protein [candidate division WOR-3 bacterium]|jgi:radical SAM superfamily enzyme YgiQ (UPF0313 family)|nr:radical SAM protein [candidate division WOR-3 bacterium]